MAKSQRSGASRDSEPTGTQGQVEEILIAARLYAVEQVIGPLRGAGRWLMFGLAGAFSLGLALLFGMLATLRLVQDLGGSALDGSWSFVPYLVTAVAAAVAIGVALSRINTEPLAKE